MKVNGNLDGGVPGRNKTKGREKERGRLRGSNFGLSKKYRSAGAVVGHLETRDRWTGLKSNFPSTHDARRSEPPVTTARVDVADVGFDKAIPIQSS